MEQEEELSCQGRESLRMCHRSCIQSHDLVLQFHSQAPAEIVLPPQEREEDMIEVD